MNSGVKRFSMLFVFVAMLWAAAQGTGGQRTNPVPGNEYSFETSRRGFQPIDYPGPLTRFDFSVLLLRRQGGFHLPLTRYFREWQVAPHADLWVEGLPGVLKVQVDATGVMAIAQPQNLRLGVHETFNLPVILRNDLDAAVPIKLVVSMDGAGPTDRFVVEPGLAYGLLNLRPTRTGTTSTAIAIYAGMKIPPEGAPPESSIHTTVNVPTEVVEWGTLRLTTVEAGAPTPARVYVSGSDGLSYAPNEAGPRSTLSRITWTHGDYYFYSRGEHLLRLPEGTAQIEAVRGIEYKPVSKQVEIRAGQTTELTLNLKRISNLSAGNWYGGDVHIHANYNDHAFITPEDVRLQVLGEDLNVANLTVASGSGPHINDEQYFEGRPHRLSGPAHVLYWAEEMRNFGLYGHLCLTGIKTLVKPLYTGFAGTPYAHDYPPNHEQGLNATGQGGAASYAHPGFKFTSDPQTMGARELPVDLALGSVQAMDVFSSTNEDAATAYWYRLLNTGLRCSISAGSDSFTNHRYHWVPGGHRVYVHTAGPLDYQQWVDNYREGRSFATNGPILRFTVNGKPPGSDLPLKAGDRVSLQASATSFVPMDTLELVMNGEVIATARAQGDKLSVNLSKQLQLESGAWLAARVRGPFHRYLVNDSHLYAHTSPVYCQVDGKGVARKEDADFFVNWIDQLIGMVHQRGSYASEAQKQEVIALFEKGRSYYEKISRAGR